MEIKFDSNQQFQIDAVNAIVDVFEGLPLGGEERFRLRSEIGGMFKGIEMTELGFGNNLTLTDADLFKNLHIVQERNGIDKITSLMGRNFSVEMETGTGKTYVYLRTIFELNQKYGFKKFVIVVPSVAIREGVLKNIAITERHFKNIYNNIPFSYAVYDSKKMSIVKNFALNNGLNILIINIDAFRKDFSEGGEDKGLEFSSEMQLLL
jgi:type III restriction enzyme